MLVKIQHLKGERRKLALTSLRKDQLKMSKSFALYYGYGEVEKMSRYDIAIIEPKGMTVEDIRYMKDRKTLVLSYLSLVEVHPTEPIFKELTDEDFLFINHEKVINLAFGTYLVNLKSEKWLKYLHSEVEHRFIFMGTDGLFLDTIGDLELPSIPVSIREEQIQAALHILSTLKTRFPQHLLIQNNGLEHLCEHTAPYIDGILWENPPLTLNPSKEWVEVIMSRLERIQEKYGLRLFMLFEETIEKERKAYSVAKKVGKAKNYLVYFAPAHYVAGVTSK